MRPNVVYFPTCLSQLGFRLVSHTTSLKQSVMFVAITVRLKWRREVHCEDFNWQPDRQRHVVLYNTPHTLFKTALGFPPYGIEPDWRTRELLKVSMSIIHWNFAPLTYFIVFSFWLSTFFRFLSQQSIIRLWTQTEKALPFLSFCLFYISLSVFTQPNHLLLDVLYCLTSANPADVHSPLTRDLFV